MDMKEKFTRWFSDFIDSDHEYVVAMEETTEDSPYHREDNVRTHTNMVVMEYVAQVGEAWTKNDLLGAIAAAFHDVGKPHTEREEYSKKYGKVIRRYNNHEEYSAAMWIDFWFKNEMGIKNIVGAMEDAYNVAVMIAYHLPYSLGNDKLTMLRTHLYHYQLEDVFGKLLLADSRGRIYDEDVTPRNVSWNNDNGFFGKKGKTYNLSDEIDVHLMVGAPGSGKSTYCGKYYGEDDVIYSFDEVRELSFPEFDTYHEKFNAFCEYDFANDKTLHQKFGVPEKISSQQVFLDYLMKFSKDSVDTGVFVIDNTNTNRKSRRKAKNTVNANGVKAIYFIGTFDDILRNNESRSSYKSIPYDVLKRMYFMAVPPILGEFDSIELVPIGSS